MRDYLYFLWPLPLLWCACIPTATLLPLARVTDDTAREVLSSVDRLDALCQARASTSPQLLECRAERDKAAAALRRQSDAWGKVSK